MTSKKVYIIISWFLVALCMGVIFYLSARPATESQEMSDSLMFKFIEIFGIEISGRFIRKLAHATEFFSLAVLLFNAIYVTFKHKMTWAFALCVAILYAISDEIHQLFVEGRACQLKDVLIDSSGAIVGILISLIILKLINSRKERGKKNGSTQTF